MASGRFREFSGKNPRIARGFAREILRFSIRCRPGNSLKRCGKSSSLHSKSSFLLRGCRFFVSNDISGGPLGHHNFWSRNARKSIKGSKDSDSNLVSNENFSEILSLSSWAVGQVTWAKIAPKLLHLCCHSQKIRNPQPKNFFSSAV